MAPDSDITAALQSAVTETKQDAGSAKTIAGRGDAVADRRDWIAEQIIRVLVYSVAAGLLICLIEGFRSEWSTATAHAADLIKSVVLPVVTLVLGYYFGQASAR